MTNRGFALLLIVLLVGSGMVFAQSNFGSEQLYSSGVHAFNMQRYAEAIGFFDQMEAKDSQDPRAFFFRGLAYSRLGDAAAGNADFETAAKVELTVAGRSFSVPKALERIQGRERTTIEQYRRAAKRVWEVEENLRRQDEFLTQKAENQRFYQSIIESGESGLPLAPTADISGLALPFGAQPAAPFGTTQAASQPNVVPGVTRRELTADNPFFDDVSRIPVIVEPEPTPLRLPTRQQDPGESGIFDSPNADGFDDGFDASALLQRGNSATPQPGIGIGLPGLGWGLPGAGAQDDDFPFSDADFADGSSPFSAQIPTQKAPSVGGFADPAKDSGRFFGRGVAVLFSKPGSAGIPSGTPVTSPPTAVPLPNDFDDIP
ncbi:MAG: hypothetical protein FWD31_03545 [Planctomycetaceae bacterium]|nr:hypothetical protein [Planctomycetaceae bacterium]